MFVSKLSQPFYLEKTHRTEVALRSPYIPEPKPALHLFRALGSLDIRAEAEGQGSVPWSGFRSLCLPLEPRAGAHYSLHGRMAILSTSLHGRSLFSIRKARASGHCTHSQSWVLSDMFLSPGKFRSQEQALPSGLKSKDNIEDFFWRTCSRESGGSRICQKTPPPQSSVWPRGRCLTSMDLYIVIYK